MMKTLRTGGLLVGLCLTVSLFALVLSKEPQARELERTWDKAAAARYMDARMDLWWERAKALKTGEDETKCLSCHTALPYVLARPVLRKARAEGGPTASEQKILDFVSKRVAYRDSDQPYYDQNPAKQTESRGTEAVLNALVLSLRDRESGATTPGESTVAAFTRLWDVQRADGAWDWLNFEYEPAESADSVFQGAAIAAFAVGSEAGTKANANEKGKAGFEKLRAYIRANFASQNLYNRTWALLASSRAKTLLTSSQRKAVIQDLQAQQRPDGGWSFSNFGPWRWSKTEPPFAPKGELDKALLAESDGFATGFAVAAMRASGVADTHPSIQKGQNWLISHQAAERSGDPAWAPWRAYSLNHDREHGGPRGEDWRRMFMSDFATSFSVLALQ